MKNKLPARPNGSGWDERAVSQRFLGTANNAERYLTEVRTKVKGNRAYERVYDETLAQFYVFNRIAVSASLTSATRLRCASGTSFEHNGRGVVAVTAIPTGDYTLIVR
jgi:hypothetical protein